MTRCADIYSRATLATLPYSTVEGYARSGLISAETWGAYCYVYRDACYRYSPTGELEARRHALGHGLPLPYSDREATPEEAAMDRAAWDERKHKIMAAFVNGGDA